MKGLIRSPSDLEFRNLQGISRFFFSYSFFCHFPVGLSQDVAYKKDPGRSPVHCCWLKCLFQIYIFGPKGCRAHLPENGLRKIRRISIFFRCTETGQRPNVCTHALLYHCANSGTDTVVWWRIYLGGRCREILLRLFLFFFSYLFFIIFTLPLWPSFEQQFDCTQLWKAGGKELPVQLVPSSAPQLLSIEPELNKKVAISPMAWLFPLVLPLTLNMIIDALAYEWAWRTTRFGRSIWRVGRHLWVY